MISFYFDHVCMIGGVTRLGGLPGLLGGVTLSAGVTICHVNVSRWGSLPSRSRVHVTKESNKPNTSVSKLTQKFTSICLKQTQLKL